METKRKEYTSSVIRVPQPDNGPLFSLDIPQSDRSLISESAYTDARNSLTLGMTHALRHTPVPKAQSRKFFYIYGRNGGVSTLIQVRIEESSKLDVDWLLNEYVKAHITDPDFDMGSISCLRCRIPNLNYDYMLSNLEVPLNLFPHRMDLEPYYVELCHGLNITSFHILDMIGFGAFGQVVVVRKKDSGSVYAMKIVKKDRFIQNNNEVYIFEEKKILTLIENQFVVNFVKVEQDILRLSEQSLRVLRYGFVSRR